MVFDRGDSEATGPLKGIRVLDWTMWQFGPMAGVMMGDMGADVIKIEALDGDAGRALARATSLTPTLPEGRNAYFEANNRNKRGIAVNLKSPEGREIVYKLVQNADVFIQNFRHGVSKRLEMDYDTLRAINPMLVYGSATGYGPKGPDAALPSFDGCGQARSGLMISATPSGWDEPVRISQGISDQMGAIMLCQGVLAALVARQIQGVGQKVDASHLSSNMWLQGMGMTMSLILDNRQFGAYDRKSTWNVLSNIYKCKDGRWIQLQHLQPDRYWESFMSALGLAELVNDPRFSEPEARTENREELVEIMDARFVEKTAAEWDRHFRETGEFIYAVVQSVNDLVDDPQVIANDYITTFDHPVIGPVKMCSHPNIYSETPSGIFKEAPELGQHTEEILVDELGYTWDEVTTLQDKGVIL